MAQIRWSRLLGATAAAYAVAVASLTLLFGNPLTESGGEVLLTSSVGDLTPVTDHGNGTYTAALTSTVAGRGTPFN